MGDCRVMRCLVLWNMHPGFVIVGAVLSLVFGVGSAVILDGFAGDYGLQLEAQSALHRAGAAGWIAAVFLQSPDRPWLSLLVGLVVGTPFALAYKAIRGRNADFFARFHLMPLRQKLRWSNQKVNMRFTAYLIPPGFAAGAVAWLLGMALPPAFFAAWVSLLLMYPEQKVIYNGMKAGITEDASGM